jgi:uncharacterized protein (DUF924 family)
LEHQQDILDFWFLPKDHPDHGQNRDVWFQKNEAFDTEIKTRFLSLFEEGASGNLLSWTDTKEGSLALIILFDQFSRNMFRGDARAFSADGKAREIARHILDRGFYEEMTEKEKQFAILPFEHSEDLEDQKFCLKLFQEIGDEELIRYAQAHLDIIEKFGRFPHRNETLGRESTHEEKAFLETPGSSF